METRRLSICLLTTERAQVMFVGQDTSDTLYYSTACRSSHLLSHTTAPVTKREESDYSIPCVLFPNTSSRNAFESLTHC